MHRCLLGVWVPTNPSDVATSERPTLDYAQLTLVRELQGIRTQLVKLAAVSDQTLARMRELLDGAEVVVAALRSLGVELPDEQEPFGVL